MKNKLLLASISILASCSSIKYQNEHINDLIPENKLKNDVDFVHKKLEKLHPKLYWYITKESFDSKFDSVKKTITQPLTSNQFFDKIAPIVCTVREGHTYVFPRTIQFTKQQSKLLITKGDGPLSQFEFEFFDKKLYIIKNKSYNKKIIPGTEVLGLNEEKIANIYSNFGKNFTSDGYNSTLRDNFFGNRFPTIYSLRNGIKDSINYTFKLRDSIKNITIFRKVVDSVAFKKSKIKHKLSDFEKAKAKANDIQKDILGYDKIAKRFNRNLKFVEKDSSVAIIKIKGFMVGNYSKFYQESFSKIQYYKSKSLIIDLRNNGGGRLDEISELYSYLADSTFTFVDEAEVVSKTSMMHSNFFKNATFGGKIVRGILAPIYYPIIYFLVHKKEDGKYYFPVNSKAKKVKAEAFKGKIYVLINGGSFSASSIISSNLKGSKRAFFVGQETGGAYNGTVAGQMPIIEMPNSKLKIRIGLMATIPHYKTNIEGHGIYPDKQIIPTLQDRLNGIDPEMDWILNDIKTLENKLNK
jgi:C-terminal processing protease CtpA/Prc